MAKQPNGAYVKREYMAEVAKEAIVLYKKHEEDELKNASLKNTRILLAHYMELKTHSESKVDGIDTLGLSEETAQLRENLIIESIKRTQVRTRIVIDHVDSCLRALHESAVAAGEEYKFKVLESLYLDNEFKKLPYLERISALMEELFVSDTTIKRYEREMCNELSVLLFGIVALRNVI